MIKSFSMVLAAMLIAGCAASPVVPDAARSELAPTGKLRAGDRASSYEYPLGMGCDWGGLNIEQQAMVVEHRFRLSRGQPVPADPAFYDRVCPIGPRIGV